MRGMTNLLARMFDVAMIVAGALVASQIRFDDVSQRSFYLAFVAFAAAFSLAVFPALGVYESWRGRSKSALAGQVALSWLIVQACAMVLMFSLHRIDFVSRLWFVYWTGLAGAGMIAGRMVTHTVLGRVRNAGLNLKQVAVAGCGDHCDEIVRKIDLAPAAGFRATAAYNVQTGAKLNTRVPVFEDHEAFANYVRTQNVGEVWLALPLTEERTILKLVDEFRNDLINIRFMPDVRTLSLFEGSVTNLLGVPTINLAASPLPPNAMMQKEIFDRVFAAAALIAVAPVMIACAVAVKISSRGPVFFKQRRKGADGRVFSIYKFRSMRMHVEKEGELRQATRNDPRITRVGAFLRRTSLDELPQFFNVLRGDMSVVGPRPHALEHDDLYQKVVSGYIHRYRIKPGITGWAQVNGFRGETDRIEKMEGRVAHDLYYLGNWSFGLDMKIIFATIFKGLRHTNAY
ncbi:MULTISPECIES: undecaprenyl-phosphate glucose phosphotransferase [Burkholderiaceae]|jgi:Undecaprenyl-phosphate glucose phosphotransferase|uniref:Undecaprenyl-phosphate galactosephosphotransferase n=1 Tax=Caballeronia sordidicola TaxID=196367 RepID=A0A242MH35_CABSO|nr:MULTISPECIES: undecaprenyl-phosphate glucose phosphotransferase [Burkholderiaceae]MDP9156684.1 undecaprenyl-phosphate glucose phosphotransferase [Pseudomonadota bacterium]AME22777.1 undecaprenyl-phosphate glucose phosphotransferase [Burkholderia sp. PAMC 26561]AMM14664.1 undecaprenyl-phosphate glucose phosphotransferase [Burkholderia sp. PAMC 28687]OTP70466.1 Undecaprenyl-phosphate galactosephosphotransferase [Caballeronia sordidicola]OTP78981.1 Undecaprenyl-phosphate galactosephosphotransf